MIWHWTPRGEPVRAGGLDLVGETILCSYEVAGVAVLNESTTALFREGSSVGWVTWPLHLAGAMGAWLAFCMSFELSAGLATAVYPVREYRKGENEHSQTANNSTTNSGSVLLVAWT